MKIHLHNIKLILIIALATGNASAAAEDWTECPKNMNLLGDFAADHELAMRFNSTIPLNPGRESTQFRSSGKWRKYWGTALLRHSITRNATITAGTTLYLQTLVSDGGHLPVARPRSLEEFYSSSVVIFRTPDFRSSGEGEGVYMLTVNGQPYSNIPIHRLERLLPVTMLCAPLGTTQAQ